MAFTTPESERKLDELMTNMTRDSISDFAWAEWDQNLITLRDTDTVETAITTLSDNDILSAPVLQGLDTYWGFTDMMQLVSFLVKICPSWADKPPVFSVEYWRKRREFRNTTIREIALDWVLPGEFPNDIDQFASVHQCFERMASLGAHRLAVTSARGRVVGVVTQSMIIEYLANHMDWWNAARSLPITNFRPFAFVATIRESAPALEAFQLMADRNVNGIAVVDASGKMTDMISTRDLRGMGAGGERFSFLWRSVRDFKAMVRRHYPSAVKNAPMVTRDATFGEVVTMMNNQKVHRVFVVSSLANPIPVDVISQTDILRHLLEKHTPSWRRTSSWI